MDSDESCIPSLDDSDINDIMILAEESPDFSKKRKLRSGEPDLFPLPKHFCPEQQLSIHDSSCPSPHIESAECYKAMVDTKTGDETFSSAPCYSTASSGSVTSSIVHYCSKVHDKTQDAQDFTQMEFNSLGFAVENLQELLDSQDSNPAGSYILSSARWIVSKQDSDEATTKPTIDQEFEEYFSTLMM